MHGIYISYLYGDGNNGDVWASQTIQSNLISRGKDIAKHNWNILEKWEFARVERELHSIKGMIGLIAVILFLKW